MQTHSLVLIASLPSLASSLLAVLQILQVLSNLGGHFLLLFYFFGILASYFRVPPAGSPLLPRLSSSILPAHIFLHFQLLLSSSPMLLLFASVALFTPFSRASSVELVTIRNPSRWRFEFCQFSGGIEFRESSRSQCRGATTGSWCPLPLGALRDGMEDFALKLPHLEGKEVGLLTCSLTNAIILGSYCWSCQMSCT